MRRRVQNQNTKKLVSFSLANESRESISIITLYKYIKGLTLKRAKSYLKDNTGTGACG